MRRSFRIFPLLLACAPAAPQALDESLAREYGKNRVKVIRLDTPRNISQTELASAKARYEARMENCRGEAGRNRQYCMQEAESLLMADERRIRDKARRAEAEREAE